MNKIRVGLLIDGLDEPFWVYRMIEEINAGGYAEIVLVVKRKNPVLPKKSFGGWLKENLRIGLIKAYTKAEKFAHQPQPDAFEEKNIGELIKSADLLEVDCIEKKFTDYLHDADIAKIRAYKIDVFVRLGFRILKGEILKTARLGIWSYHHGDNFRYRGGPAGLWEVLKRDNEVGSILQILTENLDGGEVLYRSWSQIHPMHNKTLNGFYWKTSLFIPRKLRELYENGEEAFFKRVKAENEHLYFYSGKNYTVPTNLQFLKLFIPIFFKGIGSKIRKIFYFEQWVLLYAFSNNSPETSVYRFKKLAPPKDRFWADPTVVYKDGKHFVFFEELLYDKKKETGHICVMEINKKGIQSDPVVILKKPYHLSYPFIFEHNGQYYMIPETEENATIQLYQAVNFPYEWEFKMNLMEGLHAVDATMFFKDNKFWLFANIRQVEGGPYSEELFLFSSDTLLTNKWVSHPANPVVSDVKSSRPAGRLFYHNDKLYRPSQDCSIRYGYSTIINEVIILNEKEYKEIKVSAIRPEWDNKAIGTHSLSFDRGLTFIDALVKRRRLF